MPNVVRLLLAALLPVLVSELAKLLQPAEAPELPRGDPPRKP